MSQNYARTMKVNDTGPPVKVQILRSDGEPQDLTGATVTFLMYAADGTELVNAPASIELPTTSGVMIYNWQEGDTAVLGRHLALFEVVYPDNVKESFPSEGYMWFSIEEDLNGL